MNRESAAYAHLLLQQMLGVSADFREGQWEAIHMVANQKQRLLVVQRTGWGKSVVYFLATKLLREAGCGPTLLVSPLLALMRNQVLAATRLGLRAKTINCANADQWEEIKSALDEDRCDLLMVSPERLGNPTFIGNIMPGFQRGVGLFVVDEAHCISDWGHDFRPDYRRIVRVLRNLAPEVPVLCTTATANDRVVADVVEQIPEIKVSRGPLIRNSLRLFNISLSDQAERLAWLAHFVPQLPGSGIIYCLTIQDCRRVATWLQQNGIVAAAYHSETENRETVEQMLLDNQVKVLVATVALGMGFDKPDLGFVVHFQRPASVVAYYQQVGRAGRAVEKAFGILLSGREDDEISDYFIRTAFPPPHVMANILRLLEQAGELAIDQIAATLNISRGTAERGLKLLEVDGAVAHHRGRFCRTANAWEVDPGRGELITRQRRAEVEQMRQYVAHDGCLMEFLSRALDDPSPQPCGKCMNCGGNTHRREPPRALVTAALEFLRGDSFVLQPRNRWPVTLVSRIEQELPGAVERSRKGNLKVLIPERVRPCDGRVLCVYGDAGWGHEVAKGKYHAGEFSSELVSACVKLIRESWHPDPMPGWVTAVPSLHKPELVSGFAQRVADQLGIPFYPVIEKVRQTSAQKEMQCSSTQLGNVLGAFRVVPFAANMSSAIPESPVLLLDDVVDSGWTLTWLAILLRAHGSGPVYPMSLAKASPRGS